MAKAGLPTPDADNGGLILPPGFRAIVVADNLKPLRNLTVAPNGDIYVKTRKDGIYALRDTNGDGRADVIKEFGSGGGLGIALHGDWLYESTDDHVFRYKLTPGELVPAGEPQRVIHDLPNGHQHEARPSPSAPTACFTSRPARPPTPTAARRTVRWAPPARTRPSS